MSEAVRDPHRVTGSKIGITLAAISAAFMACLDISIVNVALSDIAASLGCSMSRISWLSTGYMMSNILVIPLTGWLQRRFGFRRYFSASILLFTLASVGCGMATTLPVLVAARILQGLGGGAIIPTAQSLLLSRYPKEQYATVAGLFGLGALSGPLLGQSLGGYLIDVSSWHMIFLVNTPLGLLSAALIWLQVKQPGFRRSREPIDFIGVALLAVGLPALVYVLEEGNRHEWFASTQIIVCSVGAGFALILFTVHGLESCHPVVDLRLFANRNYTYSTLISLAFGAVTFSNGYLLATYCGGVMGYSPMEIGRLYRPASLLDAAFMPAVALIAGRADQRWLVAVGIMAISCSLWMDGQFTQESDYFALCLPLMVFSLGLGLIFIPLSLLAVGDMPPAQHGSAAGLFNFTRELGGSVGIACMSSYLDHRVPTYVALMGEHVHAYDPFVVEHLMGARGFLRGLSGDSEGMVVVMLKQRLLQQALVRAFNDGFRLVALVFAATLLLVVLLKRAPPGSGVDLGH